MDEWIKSAKRVGLRLELADESYYIQVGRASNLIVLETKSRKGFHGINGSYFRTKQLYHFYFKYDDCFYGYDEIVIGDERLILSGKVLGPGSLHPEEGPVVSLNSKRWTEFGEIPKELFTKFYRKTVEGLLVD